MDEKYRIRIVRGETEFEAEGDKAFVLEMLTRFEGAPDATAGTPKTSKPKTTAPNSSEPRKVLSVREFVQRVGAKRHADKVLAFGYYLERYGGNKEFTAADINNLYYEAKLETSNTSQAIIGLIKKGFVMDAPGQKKGAGKKRYLLTQTGEQHVENRL